MTELVHLVNEWGTVRHLRVAGKRAWIDLPVIRPVLRVDVAPRYQPIPVRRFRRTVERDAAGVLIYLEAR